MCAMYKISYGKCGLCSDTQISCGNYGLCSNKPKLFVVTVGYVYAYPD